MYQGSFVDNEKTVMELWRLLDRERVVVLRVELRHVNRMKKVLAHVLHNDNRNTLPLLCDERQHRIVEIRVDDDQFLLRHAHEPFHQGEAVTICDQFTHLILRQQKHELRRESFIVALYRLIKGFSLHTTARASARLCAVYRLLTLSLSFQFFGLRLQSMPRVAAYKDRPVTRGFR